MSADALFAPAATGDFEAAIEEAIEKAKRAYALQNFEQAVDYYASALEIKTRKHGDASPECVDLYFAYGKALLENAIAQNSVLGKEETSGALEGEKEETRASGSRANASDARIHFCEDSVFAEDNDASLALEESNQGDPTIDLFAEAIETGHKNPASDEEEEGDDDAEPEDDFNAAWEVLEVARSLYEARKDADGETKLRLADTYIALGDVSLETEKLEQAVSDYIAAAALKTALLPLSSRQIAEINYKICIVYDMTAGRLASAIEHAQKAEASVRARLKEINLRLQSASTDRVDLKGKGRAVSPRCPLDTQVDDMSRSQLEYEVKELEGLLEDVLLKIEELKYSPAVAKGSAPELAARELDRDLNNPTASKPLPVQVNDLSSMVVKKKKQVQETVDNKRKADENVMGSSGKKAKVNDSIP